MSSDKVVVIRPDGGISSVYDDNVPFNEIGSMKCERATSVSFDEHDQMWRVFFINPALRPLFIKQGKEGKGFKKRQDALNWEVEQLNKALESGLI